MNVIEITAERNRTPEKLRLAAYCRVSSNSEDQLHSFAAQIRYYKDYERMHPEYRLVDVYADEGTSGLSMEKRAELQRLLRDCKRGKIDRIIVKSVSRFARNTSELLTALRFLKEVGVSVFFEEQGIDSDKLNSEMILTFPGMAAQQESVAISGNMRWSYKKRMESGEFNCCAPAYGFALADGKLIVNEAEASVIRCIFDRFLRGLGKQTIANQLNAEKVPHRESKKWYAFMSPVVVVITAHTRKSLHWVTTLFTTGRKQQRVQKLAGRHMTRAAAATTRPTKRLRHSVMI